MKEDGFKVKNVNANVFADIIESLVKHAEDEVFPRGDCLFQDDETKIQRTSDFSSTVYYLFNNKIPPREDSKIADLYPIENRGRQT